MRRRELFDSSPKVERIEITPVQAQCAQEYKYDGELEALIPAIFTCKVYPSNAKATIEWLTDVLENDPLLTITHIESTPFSVPIARFKDYYEWHSRLLGPGGIFTESKAPVGNTLKVYKTGYTYVNGPSYFDKSTILARVKEQPEITATCTVISPDTGDSIWPGEELSKSMGG